MFDLVAIHRLTHIEIDSETESPLRGIDTVLEENSIPYRNDGREEDEESKNVDIPYPPEAVKGNEDDRKSKCHSTKDLYKHQIGSLGPIDPPTLASRLISKSNNPIFVCG